MQVCTKVGQALAQALMRLITLGMLIFTSLIFRAPSDVPASALNHTSPLILARWLMLANTWGLSIKLPLVIRRTLIECSFTGINKSNSFRSFSTILSTSGNSFALVGSPLPENAISFSFLSPSAT